MNPIENAIALMKQLRVAPDARHYALYITSLRKQRLNRRAVEVIEDDMLKNSIIPSIACYEQAIYACIDGRNIELASRWASSCCLEAWFAAAVHSRP